MTSSRHDPPPHDPPFPPLPQAGLLPAQVGPESAALQGDPGEPHPLPFLCCQLQGDSCCSRPGPHPGCDTHRWGLSGWLMVTRAVPESPSQESGPPACPPRQASEGRAAGCLAGVLAVGSAAQSAGWVRVTPADSAWIPPPAGPQGFRRGPQVWSWGTSPYLIHSQQQASARAGGHCSPHTGLSWASGEGGALGPQHPHPQGRERGCREVTDTPHWHLVGKGLLRYNHGGDRAEPTQGGPGLRAEVSATWTGLCTGVGDRQRPAAAAPGKRHGARGPAWTHRPQAASAHPVKS